MASRIARGLCIAALMIGYPLLAHYTNYTHESDLGALVAIAPLVLIAVLLAWRSPRRLIMLAVLALSCLALWAEWSALEQHFGLVYWLQHVAFQLILFMTFARTLLAGRMPLCTRFAEALHGSLTPQHERYARQVTVAWSLFFAAMALASTLLFFLAPLATWSVFANLLTLPLVALMFIAEYWLRRSLLADMRPTPLLDALRAFRSTEARPR
jgi:uncharacterized membrane protein